MKEKFIEAGEIVNTHGVRGEVKIMPWTDTPEFLRSIKTLYVDGKEGLHCVELMDSMLLSAWENREVALPIDDDRYYGELQKHIAQSRDKNTGDILIDNSMSFGGTK